MEKFDLIVVGAGHAGIEAALVGARKGLKVLMATSNVSRIGYMSCNPSIGGLGKGHMVKELDVLGGQMGVVADQTCIQFKRLNARKGPAVRGSRAQCDKDLYNEAMIKALKENPRITVLETEIKELLLNKSVCYGVVTDQGVSIEAKAVIMTTGTFMNAVMHIGLQQISGGRVGDKATVGLSDQLKAHGFTVTRLKTGTPARLYRDSIDWSKTIAQYGDEKFYPFSYRSSKKLSLPQIACYLSYTNEKTHEIIRKNLDKSPMFLGIIEGVGPRYCPSIEDKITRFADKEMHQTFLEPEGLNTDSIYLQGISTSLPEDVQYEFLRTIPGLENVKMIKPGYAVEYDFFEPTQLEATFETKAIQNLYFAGQINGTSGYEEAASQGLWAGVNAAQKILGGEAFILGRDEAYMGVLVDDLVTKGTKEPYRMMTSRAEHRLVLREDNVIERLLSKSKIYGLVSEEEFETLSRKLTLREDLYLKLSEAKITPTAETQKILESIPTPVLQKQSTLADIMRRDEVNSSHLKLFNFQLNIEDEDVVEPVEIRIKYSGYIQKQKELINQMSRLDKFLIPSETDYGLVRGLSREEVEKLSKIKPRSIGQAGRISGVNPSAVQALVIHLKGKGIIRQETNEATRRSWQQQRRRPEVEI